MEFEGILWDVGDRTHVGCMQGQHPSQCALNLSLNNVNCTLIPTPDAASFLLSSEQLPNDLLQDVASMALSVSPLSPTPSYLHPQIHWSAPQPVAGGEGSV